MVNNSGIGTHIRGLIEGMAEFASSETLPNFTFLGDPSALSRYPAFAMLGDTINVPMAIYSFREQMAFPRLAKAGLYHFPHYNTPISQTAPFVVTVHDLIHMLFPQYVASRTKWLLGRRVLKHAVTRARAVFTVSEGTRSDLVTHLGVDPSRIYLTPNAVSRHFSRPGRVAIDTLRRRLSLDEEFFLAAGVDKPHKNFVFLVESFVEWRKRSGASIELVICGVKGGNGPLAKFVADHRPVGVRILEFQNYSVMPELLAAAKALVFPSLYEGFGLPILEAQRVGTPVLSSRASCMPWVAGERGALFFDPHDSAELADCFDRIMGSEEISRGLAEAGHANEARFSWADSARKTLEVYARVYP